MPALAQPGASNDACDACKMAVHVLDDLLCDPYVDDNMVGRSRRRATAAAAPPPPV